MSSAPLPRTTTITTRIQRTIVQLSLGSEGGLVGHAEWRLRVWVHHDQRVFKQLYLGHRDLKYDPESQSNVDGLRKNITLNS